MRPFATVVICAAATAIPFTPATGRAQSPNTGLEASAILARPISPGTIALLAEHWKTPGVQVRLTEALTHTDPNVRAATVRRVFDYLGVRRVLSDSELQTVSRAIYGDPDRISPIRNDSPEPGAAPSGRQDQISLRVAAGYPPKLISSTFAEAGCDLRKLDGDRVVGGADLTLRSDGRALSVSVINAPVPPGCMAASRALLLTYTADLDRIIEEGQHQLVMLPFDDDFVTCHESDASGRFTANDSVRPGGQIEVPRKTRDVRPVYPVSAQAEKIQGVVIIEGRITQNGCFVNAAVLRSVDPRLDWAATRAVVGWRFTPTLLNGQPVPVIMTVTVQFSLR